MTVAELMEHLKTNFPDPEEELAVMIWCKEDVLQAAAELGKKMDPDKAQEILEYLHNSADCNEGITWRHIHEELYHEEDIDDKGNEDGQAQIEEE